MLIERLCALLMAVLVADVFLGVFSRYVLQATLVWYDEVARFCFIWIVFLGAAIAVRRGLHFRMRLLIDRLGDRVRPVADQISTATVIAFGALLAAGGFAIMPVAMRQATDALEISMAWFYGAIPTGGALMILFALGQFRRRVEGS